MAKAGSRRSASGKVSDTRRRAVAAAIETLKREGFAGASAREIARTGGFAQGVIFYHFGSVNELLLAALDETSAKRMERYSTAVESAATLSELLDVAADVYREDLEAGHLKVLAELIAGASAVPELGPAVAARIEPWTRFTKAAADRVLDGAPLAELVPASDLAFAVVALYLGLELLTHLDGDRSRAESLFRSAQRLSALVGPLFAKSTTEVQAG